jgi:hypothetical protein
VGRVTDIHGILHEPVAMVTWVTLPFYCIVLCDRVEEARTTRSQKRAEKARKTSSQKRGRKRQGRLVAKREGTRGKDN